jgi:hypothetical protein
MTYEEYSRRMTFLREVLKEAQEHGDYHLEMDVREMMIQCKENYDER